jgi:hypothetical protein
MNELDAIKLEGKEFVIVDEISLAGIKYVHLANADDAEDFCIRKIVLENGKEMLTGLDSDEEFDFALEGFIKKNHKTDEN